MSEDFNPEKPPQTGEPPQEGMTPSSGSPGDNRSRLDPTGKHHDDTVPAADRSCEPGETPSFASPDGNQSEPAAENLDDHDAEPAAAELRAGIAANSLAKPELVLAPGTLKDCLEAAEKALAATASYFAVANGIVRVTRDPETGAGIVRKVGRAALVKELDALIDWHKVSRTGPVRCYPPNKVCSALLEATEFQHLPILKGFARQPFLREDGKLCSTEGYDPVSGLYASFGGLTFDVEENPTKEDAKACLSQLDDLLTEFPFRTPEDRSAALCAILTAAVRASLDAAPMFLVRAHQAGTGKSYLSRLISAFAMSDKTRPLPFPREEIECAKVLISTLREQPAVLEFDNVKGTLMDHQSLCAALTADHYQSRELGRSSMVPVATRTLFLASGNNVEVMADLTRRCITIDLDAKMDTPAARAFTNPNLVEDVLARRDEYVSMALTIVHAWIVAGMPTNGLKPLGSYGVWSGWCRECLVWLGKPDPAAKAFQSMTDDPERAKLRAFIAEVERQFGTAGFMVKEVIQHASDHSRAGSEDLRDVLMDITGDSGSINRKRLGHWVRQHQGQVVDAKKIVRASVTRSVAVWQVETV